MGAGRIAPQPEFAAGVSVIRGPFWEGKVTPEEERAAAAADIGDTQVEVTYDAPTTATLATFDPELAVLANDFGVWARALVAGVETLTREAHHYNRDHTVVALRRNVEILNEKLQAVVDAVYSREVEIEEA